MRSRGWMERAESRAGRSVPGGGGLRGEGACLGGGAMRRSIEAALLALAAVFLLSVPGVAQSGGRGGWHGGGRGWHGGHGYYGHGYPYGYGRGYYGYGGGFYGYRYPRVVIGVGLPAFWWGAPYYGYPGYGYWPPGYVYPPARVVVSERPVAQPSASAPPAYWFYCP